MFEIFNGIKGKWESISAIGLPDGYTIEIFVPARGRINGRNQGYRVKKDYVRVPSKAPKTARYVKLTGTLRNNA